MPVEKKKAGKTFTPKGMAVKWRFQLLLSESHRACECAACAESLTEESPFFARGGLYVLDIEAARRTKVGA